MRKSKLVKIDWDTVELVEPTSTVTLVERRGRSKIGQILSGAASKARARGAVYTHTQLREFLPQGLERLVYGWRLVAAAVEGDRYVSYGVEAATRVILETSRRLSESRRG